MRGSNPARAASHQTRMLNGYSFMDTKKQNQERTNTSSLLQFICLSSWGHVPEVTVPRRWVSFSGSLLASRLAEELGLLPRVGTAVIT
ncbi:hypothetical protein CYFUS_006182 [Cystobacter fuscus]|uniref:Uncharacterized protein n=1 Tax=Cystobacter fuscus TaxID=43 RepID=A0A250JC21_9BACT|nr:hypothetical protein CYFUS_006182 [Cystobacter fuscus]